MMVVRGGNLASGKDKTSCEEWQFQDNNLRAIMPQALLPCGIANKSLSSSGSGLALAQRLGSASLRAVTQAEWWTHHSLGGLD
jgi:hypothetical protein